MALLGPSSVNGTDSAVEARDNPQRLPQKAIGNAMVVHGGPVKFMAVPWLVVTVPRQLMEDHCILRQFQGPLPEAHK